MDYDVAVIGGGVVGAANLYVLSRFTNASAVLIEKNQLPGLEASKSSHNSQTHHRGDIETQYSLEETLRVKEQADLLAAYVRRRSALRHDVTKMLLATGDECAALRLRYAALKQYFPKLELLDAQGVADYEPRVAEGREGAYAAIVDPEGLAIDFGRVASSFIEEARRPGIDALFGRKANRISRSADGFAIKTGDGTISARSLIISAGAHTLPLAQQLGLGEEYCVFPVAGCFFKAPKVLNGKVYTFQRPGIPFVAVHGDPDVNDASVTRLGPTAYPAPFLEWRKWRTALSVLRAAPLRKALRALRVLDKPRRDFFLENIRYLGPQGRKAFLPNAQRIVPSLTADDLERDASLGGVRPQVVDAERGCIVHGEAKLLGERLIANLTPSPGASTCLAIARADARRITAALGRSFAEEEFCQVFS
ncbi:FAD-dependent oxidoreductase [Candidatus Woesearchaeota archaeon]|nr:MAG: FAD-dependent oxidoreductase [Candidatus Woesearchaeota archaeon]